MSAGLSLRLSARQIAVAGLMGAVAILLGATRLGFIPWFAGIALTVMHVPIIIGAVLEGPAVGVIIGAIFGIFSLVWANVAPTGPGDIFFQDPFVAVLPRLFIGIVAWLAYRAFSFSQVGALIAAGISGSLTNTVLVLGAIGLRGYAPWPLLLPVAVSNGLPEAGVAAFITVAVVAAWKHIEIGRGGARL
ncbi:MAG: ECF transporter S component [Anaerolineae bacterium]